MQRHILGRTPKGPSVILGKIKHFWHRTNKKNLAKNILLAGVALILTGIIVISAIFAWYAKNLPNPNALLDRNLAQSTKIFDKTGTHLLYEIAPEEKRTLVQINQISPFIINATITAEDRNFYSHHGFSVTGYLRAFKIYILSAGKVKTGGSTITQQFVKKAILTSEKKVSRKIKELILSIAIEQIYSKEEILQMYLNEIPYGSTNYGIETAAKTYYGKSAAEVSLAEAATLAAIPQSPTTYINNPDLLKERRDWILEGMAEENYASKEEVEAALKEDTSITAKLGGKIEAPHFVLWVKSLLEEKYGSRLVETGGLNVITSLDYDKQLIAETAVTNGVTTNGQSYGFTSAGLLSIDPNNGQILAMVGSPDYFNDDIDGQVNVTLGRLQPGSSIKPIIFAAAFEKGYTPNTILWDVKTKFQTATGMYEPQNYDGGEHGPVSLRKALQGSLNIPAVKLLYLVGISEAVNFAERLGYSTLGDRSQIGLSMVLGGIQVTMLEHVNAYATLANGGTKHQIAPILKVTDPKGNILEEWKSEEHLGERVIDSNLAATMSNVLSDNGARTYIFGARNWLVLPGRVAAAKTGTTNEYKDAWTVGYTPSLVSGVWVGNANGTKMKGGADGSKIAAPIWNEYMRNALNGTAAQAFQTANIEQTGKPVLDGSLPGTTVTIDTITGKLATALTPERYVKNIICGEYHTILTYVDRKDPRGPAPTKPENDPYYQVFENAIQDYLVRKNAELKPGESALVSCSAPTEYDDIHTVQNTPEVKIMEPDENNTVNRNLTIDLKSELKLAFGRVEYLIDGSYIATGNNPNGETITLPGWVDKGRHLLTVHLYDEVDNKGEDSVTIVVDEAGSASNFRITNPFNAQEIEKTELAYSIAVEVPDAENFVSLSIRAKNLWTGEEINIGSTDHPAAITSFSWLLPQVSDYALYASAVTLSGEMVETSPIVIHVRETPKPANINISENQSITGNVAGVTTAE